MAAKKMPDAAYLRERFAYDPATGVLTWKKRPRADFRSDRGWKIWNTRYSGSIAGTRGSKDHRYVIIRYSRYAVHRIVWKIVIGRDPVNEIDHKNHDGTDNRWVNLREATRQQNCFNKRRHKQDGVEKLPGGRYRARGHCNRKTIHLGVYDTLEQAREVSRAFASNLHGEFFNSGKE